MTISNAIELTEKRPQLPHYILPPLSQIIETINERFGTDFKPEDKLQFDQVVEDLSQDETLSEQVRTNTVEQFKYAFDSKEIEAFIKRMERNEGIVSQIMSNKDLRQIAMEFMMAEVYESAKETGDAV